MKHQKLRQLYLVIGLIVTLAFGTRYLAEQSIPRIDYTQQSAVTNIRMTKLIQQYKRYTLCNHLIKVSEQEISLEELDESELLKTYPLEGGWSIEEDSGYIKIIQNMEALCPEDAKIRHIADENGFLAIYQGPVNSKGPLQIITEIKVNSLPVEWQEKIQNKELEFVSESELLEALDSLDEYL